MGWRLRHCRGCRFDGWRHELELMLGTDLGRFSWRQWTFTFTPAQAGEASVMVRARNTAGATQVDKLLFNGAGYHNNIAQKLMLKVV
jgi:sulfite dehydrogenase (cytochrome) subunit A